MEGAVAGTPDMSDTGLVMFVACPIPVLHVSWVFAMASAEFVVSCSVGEAR
jgi:hypothetical protein